MSNSQVRGDGPPPRERHPLELADRQTVSMSESSTGAAEPSKSART